MVFKVKLTEKAQDDIDEAVKYIHDFSPTKAQRWFEGLLNALEDLSYFPERNAPIPESKILERTLRSIHYYSHRIIYEVKPDSAVVIVVRVYHSARQPLAPNEIQQSTDP